MLNEIVGYALSLQQRRLWRLLNESKHYRAQVVIEIEGPLDAANLRLALQAVICRHEILRTGFQLPVGAKLPLQIVAEEALIEWSEKDFRHLCDKEKETQVEGALAEEAARLSASSQSPLRAALLRLLSEKFMLLVTISPLCVDSGGIRTLVEDLQCEYAALFGSAQSREEPIQYLQFSEWQNEVLGSEYANEGRAYWRKQNDFSLAGLRLPFEKESDAAFLTASMTFPLSGDWLARAESLAQEVESDVPAVLLACWQALLWRLTRQSQVVVSKAFDYREYEELCSGVGPYTKYLPLRCDYTSEISFHALLLQVVQSLNQARQWQQYAAPVIVPGEVAESIWPAAFPFLFDCPEAATAQESHGVRFLERLQKVCSEPYKIKLEVTRRQGQWGMELHYDAGRFARQDITCVTEQYVTLLQSAVEQPLAPVSHLAINSMMHKQELREWRRTVKAQSQQTCLHELIEEQAVQNPERIAVKSHDGRLSYRELEQRANQLARYLRKQGLVPDEVVGLFMERSAAMVVGLLAILKAGAAYLPLDVSSPGERLGYMLKDSRVRLIVSQEKYAKQIAADGRQEVLLDRHGAEIAQHSVEPIESRASGGNLAYVIYTSGSTGQPKGVMIEHHGVVNYLRWAAEAYAIQAGEGAPVHSSMAFDLTVTSLLGTLAAGKRVDMLGEQAVEALADALAQGRDYSLVKLTPSHLESLRELIQDDSRLSAKCFVVGGEALKEETVRWWKQRFPELRIVNEYGPTETAVGCSIHDATAEEERKEVAIGREIANARIYVLNEKMEESGLWETGEIYIGGEGVARGYLGRAELTAERFVPEPAEEFQGARMYRSGDLGRRRADGNLEYVGRRDEQVKIRGCRVELRGVEAAVMQEEGVREAAVVVKGEGNEKRLVCYLVAEPGKPLEVDSLRERLQGKLPEYEIPSLYVVLEEMPLTPNGKLDKCALPEPSERPKLKQAYVAPSTQAEQLLAEIWSEVLGISKIGIHDNYFALGGDSMRSVRVVALAKKCGLRISLQSLFQHQTILQLAEEATMRKSEPTRVGRSQPFSLVGAEDRKKLPGGLEDAYPLSMLQAGMLYHLELETDSAMYHNVCSFHIEAPFDLPAFQKVVDQVIARHDIFRTSFDLISYSEPLQLVHRSATLQVGVDDLRSMTHDEQQKIILDYVNDQKKHRLDLTRPPLLHFHIHRRADNMFNFTLTMCHAILDGWSVSLTTAELFDHYLRLANHEALQVALPMAATFRDFVELERHAINSVEFQQFWKEKLKGCVPVVVPRWPLAEAMNGAQPASFMRIPIPVDVLSRLNELARKMGVSLKAMFMAAHIKALSVLTGQTDILTGLSCHGRPEVTDGDQVRGNFLNTIPYRLKLEDGTWEELVNRTFAAEMELLPYQRYPLAVLQKTWSRGSLLETLFAYLNFHSLEEVAHSGKMKFLSHGNVDSGETNFTLSAIFWISPFPDVLPSSLFLQFTTDLGVEQIKTVGDWHMTALRAISENPQAQHTELDFFGTLADQDRALLEQGTNVEELDGSFIF